MGKRWTSTALEDALVSKYPGYSFPLLHSEFNTTTDLVTVICPKHGLTKQRPHKMLSQNRCCPQCGAERSIESRRYSKDKILEMFHEVHGDKYDYSKVVFENAMQPVTITCREHGDFQQTPQSHYRQKSRCPTCSRLGKPQHTPRPFSEFLSRAKNTHGDRYSYADEGYSGMSGDCTVICKIHGTFSQNCFDHINGAGCPDCCSGGFKPSLPAYFYIYYLYSNNIEYVGFGITSNISYRDKTHREEFKAAGVHGEFLQSFWFKEGSKCKQLESVVKPSLDIKSAGVTGFIREAALWDNYGTVYDIASKFYREALTQ